jgi:hypothetical protein
MFDFACHESVGVGLESAEAGADAEVDTLTTVQRAGISVGITDFAAANCNY